MPQRRLRSGAVALVAALIVAQAAQAAQAAPAAAGTGAEVPVPTGTLRNPGFEETGADGSPVGWSEHGQRSASYVEPGGRSGENRLAHWADQPYRVATSQRLTGLRPGYHTLRVSVRASGGQRDAHVALNGCGGAPERVDLPRTGAEWWVQVALTTRVSSGRCTIDLVSDGNAGDWANFDDLSFIPTDGPAGGPALRIAGADVSHLTKNEHHGAVYRDRTGPPRDALRILRANGVNYARLKVWVNPADGFSDRDDVLVKARRAHALGMGLLIDFHYSDTWADPGKQFKPAAWADLPFDQLRQAVYDHTYDVIGSLRRQGTPADMVQIGNEINGGMLWPDGRWDNWDGLAALLTTASTAVTDASPRSRVALHLAEGGNNGGHRWWFDNAVSRGVPFDVIAVSHYTYWHGPLGYLQANLFDLTSAYGKPVMVVETGYGFTLAENDHEANIFTASLQQTGGYPATPDGQADAIRDMVTTVAAVPGALGVFYWEPTWTAVDGAGWDPADPASGDGWENQALFDYSGRALPALRVLGDSVSPNR
ncbi:arabinogalactan endo-1,4-beta-galactosidase [Plantactinospora sp. S1510]|uniref:Arabinogalactan endo-beta-1,4-galactanase n=1 Tax=Plantactinospora alkalitolerans TaxID=2789879 RepID=A0ABS0GUG0_9ACTN|nr:arabinogalactan endo-1,4-beta-galactosidase [Plantactinospora alkalitolerans]MBF9129844.1 arabinogalactan endo-1,4-beta-galactosidase [Plantactinospora alkalitolerans]